MNIFVLDLDPKKCAQYHNDKHVVKMIVETAQLLCTAHHVLGSDINKERLYKKTHENHPCAIWVREARDNYSFLLRIGLELCIEYTHRYNKVHKTESLLVLLSECYPNYKDVEITTFSVCMPDKCKLKGAVLSYRNYYIQEKQHIAKWTNRDVPYWYIKN